MKYIFLDDCLGLDIFFRFLKTFFDVFKGTASYNTV